MTGANEAVSGAALVEALQVGDPQVHGPLTVFPLRLSGERRSGVRHAAAGHRRRSGRDHRGERGRLRAGPARREQGRPARAGARRRGAARLQAEPRPQHQHPRRRAQQPGRAGELHRAGALVLRLQGVRGERDRRRQAGALRDEGERQRQPRVGRRAPLGPGTRVAGGRRPARAATRRRRPPGRCATRTRPARATWTPSSPRSRCWTASRGCWCCTAPAWSVSTWSRGRRSTPSCTTSCCAATRSRRWWPAESRATGPWRDAFLERIADLPGRRYKSPGLGWDVRYEGAGVLGSALTYRGHAVHAAFFDVGGVTAGSGTARRRAGHAPASGLAHRRRARARPPAPGPLKEEDRP